MMSNSSLCIEETTQEGCTYLWRFTVDAGFNIAMTRTALQHRVSCHQFTGKRSTVEVNALAAVRAWAMSNKSLDAKPSLEYLTVHLKPLYALISYKNARAIRTNEDMSITE